jgi:cellobiose transport system permease protein
MLDAKVTPYVFVSPFFLLFLVIGMFPLGYTAWVSVHEWGLLAGQGDYAGLDNYRRVLEDRYFWNALRNTFSIFVLSSVPQVLIALALAGLLDTQLRARGLWRMSVLLPFVVAPAAVALIFGNVFGDRYGLVNELLQGIGLDPIRWHVDTLASHVAIASMVNWRWTGYNALILLAAMQAVPRDVYESAALDGAGPVRQFVSITIPMIRPTVLFVVITSTIGGLQIFAEPRLFDTQGLGGSDRQYQTLTMYLWELGWRVRDLGMASAVAWLLFLIIVVFALVNLLLSRRAGSLKGLRR